MKKIIIFFLTIFTLGLTFTQTTYAVCPVCTVAVIAGLGLSRYLGVDDTVSGVWIGGLLLSSSLWIIDWIKQKKPELPITNYQLPIILLFYLLVLLPLAWTGVIGHPLNRFWGIDKLILGTGIGSLAFLIGVWGDKKVRKIYSKQLFEFQKVVFPVTSLIIASVIFFFATK